MRMINPPGTKIAKMTNKMTDTVRPVRAKVYDSFCIACPSGLSKEICSLFVRTDRSILSNERLMAPIAFDDLRCSQEQRDCVAPEEDG